MNARFNQAQMEEELIGVMLFLGVIVAGFTLAELLYHLTHVVLPSSSSSSGWHVATIIVVSAFCAIVFRNSGLRILCILLAIDYAVILWQSQRGASLTMWSTDHLLSLLFGAIAVVMGARRTGRRGRIVAFSLGVAAIVLRYLVLERWA